MNQSMESSSLIPTRKIKNLTSFDISSKSSSIVLLDFLWSFWYLSLRIVFDWLQLVIYLFQQVGGSVPLRMYGIINKYKVSRRISLSTSHKDPWLGLIEYILPPMKRNIQSLFSVKVRGRKNEDSVGHVMKEQMTR